MNSKDQSAKALAETGTVAVAGAGLQLRAILAKNSLRMAAGTSKGCCPKLT